MKRTLSVLLSVAIWLSAMCVMLVPTSGNPGVSLTAKAAVEDVNLLENCEPNHSSYATVSTNLDGSVTVETIRGLESSGSAYGMSISPRLTGVDLQAQGYVHLYVSALVPFRLTMYDRNNGQWISFGKEFYATMYPTTASAPTTMAQALVDGQEFFPAGTYMCAVNLGEVYTRYAAQNPSVWNAGNASLTSFYLETMNVGSVTVYQFYLSERSQYDGAVAPPSSTTTPPYEGPMPTSPDGTVNLLTNYDSNWYGQSTVTTTESRSVVVETQTGVDAAGDAPGLCMQPALRSVNLSTNGGKPYIYMDLTAEVPFRVNMWDENNGQAIAFGDEFYNVMIPEGFSFRDPSAPTREELMVDNDEFFPAGTYRCVVNLGGVYEWKSWSEGSWLWNVQNAFLTSFYIETMQAGRVEVRAFFLTDDPDYQPEEPAFVPGDTNSDGVVDMLDAFAVFSAASTGNVPENVLAFADMNGDGILDMLDAFPVYRIASGA